MKRFALIGAAGYVAPRHMKAIKETGNDLVAIMDGSDSVGIIDSYFPQAAYFSEIERFDRYLDKLRREEQGIDYFVVCTPNYLHDSHCRFGLRLGADVICEKPLVLNPWNLSALEELEKETNRRINNILQLRLHPSIVRLKQKVSQSSAEEVFQVELTYITSRGQWYEYSWKGEEQKSGGILMNIGIHFFDMLIWIFGEAEDVKLKEYRKDYAKGSLQLQRAHVQWELSTNSVYLPDVLEEDVGTYRKICVNDTEIEFSGGFRDLHTLSYEQILEGKGYDLSEVSSSIKLIHRIKEIGYKK